MPHASPVRPARVVIAGGGIAAVEALMALSDLGEGRLDLELLAPGADFVLRPQLLGGPWGAPPVRIGLERLCEEFGARLHRGTLAAVDPAGRTAITADGERRPYDELVVATGARPALPYAATRTVGFGPLPELLADGAAGKVAIVVPPGTGWTLPAYELALLVAGTQPGPVEVVSAERRPLEAFGPRAAAAAARFLTERRIMLLPRLQAPIGMDLSHLADTVLAFPLLRGPGIAGLPREEGGFLPVDERMRVVGCPGVHAAGDATRGPVKQGGLAAQQAEVCARDIAHQAGAPLPAVDVAPVLRGMLEAADGARLYLRRALDGADEGAVSAEPLWRPEAAVAAWRLARWIQQRPAEFGFDALGPVRRRQPA
jgi:sulfide:quinone oxidoreductase